MGISQSTVYRIWRACNLQPHRAETFRLSNDPLFIEKVRDLVGLYMTPPDHAVVLCVGTQPLLPMRPGQPEKRTHDDLRHRTTTLFAALDAATGEGIGKRCPHHAGREFVRFLRAIEAAVPEQLDIHLVLDNYATRGFLRQTNEHPQPFFWAKSADQILASIRRFCQYALDAQGMNWRTPDSPH